MELGNIVQFLENKTILVTGATGFLAKSNSLSPSLSHTQACKHTRVDKIDLLMFYVAVILLLRASNANSAAQRLQNEITGKEVFRVLRETWGPNFKSFISEKMILVAGDISCRENLGVKDSNTIEDMRRNIDIVVNSAATTSFDERYDRAFGINTLGALHVMDFAKKCTNIKLLLHVSTAYVSREKEGVILEKPLYVGETLNGVTGLDIDEEKKLGNEIQMTKYVCIHEIHGRDAVRTLQRRSSTCYIASHNHNQKLQRTFSWLGRRFQVFSTI
ncbi:Fatty acyl-coenzyme A reductase, NAD-binding domain [Dillenia turbinata]|uniref:Fatty acyl-CoA reductase n=1 Tax=Dillenia turbinata TaxID=194707 RepID=A0AAN8VQT6_9MAGN